MLHLIGKPTDDGKFVFEMNNHAELMALAVAENITVDIDGAGCAHLDASGLLAEETQFFRDALVAIAAGRGEWVVLNPNGMGFTIDQTYY